MIFFFKDLAVRPETVTPPGTEQGGAPRHCTCVGFLCKSPNASQADRLGKWDSIKLKDSAQMPGLQLSW